VPPRRWPDPLVAARCRAVDAIWRDLLGAERDARLPETRQPDPGFTTAIHGWVLGGDLADLLDEDEMTGGDFVRNVKQVVDLLRQIAQAVGQHPGALIRFTPDDDSGIARAVGLRPGDTPRNWAVPMDALKLDGGRIAVNMVILGTPPARIGWRTRTFRIDGEPQPVLAAVVATGQFHGGLDLVPRSHPGDGHAELQLYRVPRNERTAFRTRLATGTHLPHAAITQRRIRTITLTTPNPIPFDLDGLRLDPVRHLSIEVVPSAYTLLL
jgi:hypothetical protein